MAVRVHLEGSQVVGGSTQGDRESGGRQLGSMCFSITNNILDSTETKR